MFEVEEKKMFVVLTCQKEKKKFMVNTDYIIRVEPKYKTGTSCVYFSDIDENPYASDNLLNPDTIWEVAESFDTLVEMFGPIVLDLPIAKSEV